MSRSKDVEGRANGATERRTSLPRCHICTQAEIEQITTEKQAALEAGEKWEAAASKFKEDNDTLLSRLEARESELEQVSSEAEVLAIASLRPS